MAQNFPSAADIEARIFINTPPSAFPSPSTSTPHHPHRSRTGSWSSNPPTPVIPPRAFNDSTSRLSNSSNPYLTSIATSYPSHPYANAYTPPSPGHYPSNSVPQLRTEPSFSTSVAKRSVSGYYDPERASTPPPNLAEEKRPFWRSRRGIIALTVLVLLVTVAAVAGPAVASAFVKVHDDSQPASASGSGGSSGGSGGGSSLSGSAPATPIESPSISSAAVSAAATTS
ncbi:hypothetical protein BDN72DRAFT_845058, partial [Pluteus cervinus]